MTASCPAPKVGVFPLYIFNIRQSYTVVGLLDADTHLSVVTSPPLIQAFFSNNANSLILKAQLCWKRFQQSNTLILKHLHLPSDNDL